MCEIILFVFYFNEMAFEESSDFSIFLKKKVNQQNSSLIFKKNQLFKFGKNIFSYTGQVFNLYIYFNPKILELKRITCFFHHFSQIRPCRKQIFCV